MVAAAERLFETSARISAILVIALAPLVVAVLVVAGAIAFGAGATAITFEHALGLGFATLGLALVSGTFGLVIGAGAGLYTMEIASPALRQLIRALAGGLHAVPAVGFGVVAGGGLMFAAHKPGIIIVFIIAAAALTVNIGSIAFVQMRRELARVPVGLREAAAASGADQVSIALGVVLPSLRRRLTGLWWNLLATAMAEGVALQMIFAAAFNRVNGTLTHPLPYGTIATFLLEAGSMLHGAQFVALAPLALVLLAMTLGALLIGRRFSGDVSWP